MELRSLEFKLSITYTFAIIAFLSMIWAVIELILYIEKDDPFCWWSIFCMLIGYIGVLGGTLATMRH
jgi:hypothetical protein